MKLDPRKLYCRALERWGPTAQTDMVIEEMAELTPAICKTRRRPGDPERVAAVAEEIADVRIMLEQLELVFEIECSVEDARQAKLERLEKRLAK